MDHVETVLSNQVSSAIIETNRDAQMAAKWTLVSHAEGISLLLALEIILSVETESAKWQKHAMMVTKLQVTGVVRVALLNKDILAQELLQNVIKS